MVTNFFKKNENKSIYLEKPKNHVFGGLKLFFIFKMDNFWHVHFQFQKKVSENDEYVNL